MPGGLQACRHFRLRREEQRRRPSPTVEYGRLDCQSALRAIARGGYVTHRTFFADEQDAMAAGYRPCAVCLPDAYAKWKASTGR
jgi:hypothetical protein